MDSILETTIASVIAERGRTDHDGVAIRCGSAALSFGELAGRAVGFAAWLVSRGVGYGDHIAVWLPNGISWVIAQAGAAHLGAVTVPISTRLNSAETAFIVTHSQSRLLIAPERFLSRSYGDEAQTIVDQANGFPIELLLVSSENADLPTATPIGQAPAASPDDPAVVQYTSGTTGRPKGCVLTHRAWTNNARLSAGVAAVDETNVVFSPSPFFHLFGSLTALMGTFSTGACLVTTPTFDAKTTAAAIQQSRATHMVAVPTVWLDLMATEHAARLTTLRSGVWGGGAFPRRALEHAIDPGGCGWRLDAIYGMTEAPTLTQVRAEDSNAKRLETVGRATPNVSLAILDPATSAPVSADTVGEIAMTGYNRTLGYLHAAQATEERMAGEWFRTGDLGTLDSDGFLQVTGRLTDMVVSGGANIYAREVEDVILEVANVKLAAVIARPDPRLGEVPVAWVSAEGSPLAVERAVLAHCRKRLAPYKVPRDMFVVPDLPLTASGKIHKARLIEMTQEAKEKEAR